MTIRGIGVSNVTPVPWVDQTWVKSLNLGSQFSTVFRSPLYSNPGPVNWYPEWKWKYDPNLIGKDKLPNRSTDRPNPVIPAPIDQTWTQRHVQFTGLDKLPLNQKDWPNPVPPNRIEQTWLVDHTPFLGKDKFYGPSGYAPDFDNPNPQPVQWYQDWSQSFALTHAVAQTPFPRQKDWPNATQPSRIDQFWQVNAAQFLKAPFRQSDYPNPAQPNRLDQTWTWSYNRNLVGQDKLPNRQQDWPVSPVSWYQGWSQSLALNIPVTSYVSRSPLYSVFKLPEFDVSLRTWTRGAVAFPVITGSPFNTQDWSNPTRVSWYLDYSNTLVLNMPTFMPSVVSSWDIPSPVTWYNNWSQCLLQNTLAAPPAVIPFNQYQWTLPYPVQWYQDWKQSPRVPVVLFPFGQDDWPNSTQPFRLDQSWSWNQIRYQGQDNLPNRQQSWPTPYPVQWYLPSNLGTLPFLFPIPAPLPLNQYNWPNPKEPQRQVDQSNYVYVSPFMPPVPLPPPGPLGGGRQLGPGPEAEYDASLYEYARYREGLEALYKHMAAVNLGRKGGKASGQARKH